MTSSEISAPIITVLMSCYNAARWLDNAIKSIINQSFKDFEFIIIDDGSKDETLKIINEYAGLDNRIIVVTKSNTGLADSLNIGISMARGKWIARLDADDVSEPNRLEKQLLYARARPQIVFIGTSFTEIDEDGDKKRVYTYPALHSSLLKNLKTMRKFPPHSSAFYQTASALDLGGYRKNIHRAEDNDLWLRLSEVGELACMKEPLVRIRKHISQISNDNAGRTQAIDARLSVASYFVRMNGFLDPVSNDQNEFNSFRGLIERRMEDAGIFKDEEKKQYLKNIFKDKIILNKLLKILCFIYQNPDTIIQMVYNRVMGERFSYYISKEWVNGLR